MTKYIFFKHLWNTYQDSTYPGSENKPQQIQRIKCKGCSLTIKKWHKVNTRRIWEKSPNLWKWNTRLNITESKTENSQWQDENSQTRGKVHLTLRPSGVILPGAGSCPPASVTLLSPTHPLGKICFLSHSAVSSPADGFNVTRCLPHLFHHPTPSA